MKNQNQNSTLFRILLFIELISLVYSDKKVNSINQFEQFANSDYLYSQPNHLGLSAHNETLCVNQILNQLDKQGLTYTNKGDICEITSQSSNPLQLDLELLNCTLNKKIFIKNISSLRMKRFILNAINIVQGSGFEFTTQSQIEVDELYIKHTNIEYNLFLLLNSTDVMIKNITSENSNGYNIQALNNIQIETISIIGQKIHYQSSISLDAKNEIIIQTFSAIQIREEIVIEGGNLIYINLLNVFCDMSSTDISFDSHKINIDQLQIDCQLRIYNENNVFLKNNRQELLINQIEQPKIPYSKSSMLNEQRLRIDTAYDQIQISAINLHTKYSLLVVEIKNQQQISVDQINIEIEGDFHIKGLQQLVLFQNIQLAMINSININAKNVQQTINIPMVKFSQIYDLQINSTSMNEGRYSKVMIFDQVSSILINQVVNKDLFFNQTVMEISQLNILQIKQITATMNNSLNWINDDIIQDERQSWKKLYKSIDGSRSFIFINNEGKHVLDNILYKINLAKVVADFGGFQSRFLTVFNYIDQVMINKGQFSNMRSNQNGGCLRFEQTYNVKIYNSNFVNCTSNKFGGAIYSGYLTLMGDLFRNNKAKYGGAISRVQLNERLDDFDLQNNQAELFPDQFYYQPQFITTKIFEYTQNYNGTQLLLKEANKGYSNFTSSKLEADLYAKWELIPGLQYIAIVEYVFIDTDKKKYFQQDGIFQGNLIDFIESKSNYLNFQNSQIELDITKSKAYLVFSVISSELEQNYFSFNYIPSETNVIQYKLIDCIPGQQKIFLNQMNHYFCQYCPYMTATYLQHTEKCIQCDGTLFQSCFANYSSLNLGLWRQDNSIEQKDIYPCKQNPSACQGGFGQGNELCSEGRIGVECSSCDQLATYWNSTFANKGLYSCVKCSDIQQNTLKFIVMFFGYILTIFLIIQSNFKKISNIIYQQYLSKMNLIYLGSSFRKLGLSSVYIKVLSFNASMILFSQNQIDFNLMNSIKNMQIQFNNPLEVSFSSIDCLISAFYPNTQSVGFIKLKLFLLFPLIIIPLALILPTLKLLFGKLSKKQFSNTSILILIYTLFILLYNSLLSICLDAILCKTFKNGQSVSLLDLTQTCASVDQYRIYSIIGFIVYGFSIPMVVIFGLIKNRKNLNRINVLFWYGFLYSEYKERYYFWEIVRFFVKVIQLLITKTCLSNIPLMNNLNIFSLIIYLSALIKCQPFSRSFLNKLESVSVIIVLINYLSVGVYSSQMLNSNTNKQEYLIIVGLVFALIFSVLLACLIFFSFSEAYILKLQKYRLGSRIINACSCLKKYTYSSRTHQNFRKLRQLINLHLIRSKDGQLNNESDLLLTSSSFDKQNIIDSQLIKKIEVIKGIKLKLQQI